MEKGGWAQPAAPRELGNFCTAMYLIRYAYKGSASLQLDAHTHQQEQDEIERLEGRA